MNQLQDQVFIDCAKSLARLSKCVSMQVGALFVSDRGRILSTGINGTIAGAPNCCDVHSSPGPEHSAWSNDYEIHAEMNMILELARSSQSVSRGNVYSTHSPCPNCMKHMLGLQQEGKLKIDEIVYATKYYKIPDEQIEAQKAFAAQFGVTLRQHIEVNGFVVQP